MSSSVKQVKILIKLEELGAERLYERVDCDVDYEEDAENGWLMSLILLTQHQGTQSEQVVSESIKSAKEKNTQKRIHTKLKY